MLGSEQFREATKRAGGAPPELFFQEIAEERTY
jgi:hypothetical protein